MPVSARLAMWANAGLRGYVALDDALDAIVAGQPHLVAALPARTDERSAVDRMATARTTSWEQVQQPVRTKLAAVLIQWRVQRANVRLVLPVPGDVRGVPTARDFRTAALDAGQGVYAAGLGLVPTTAPPGPSSAPSTTIWRAFEVDEPPPDPMQTSEAEHDLARAMRETASVLTASVAGGVRGVRADDLDRVRRASDDIRFPTGFAGRAAALVAQAERLDAMLTLAQGDSLGRAIDRVGIGVRTDALRSLHHTARRARLAGYNSGYPAGRF